MAAGDELTVFETHGDDWARAHVLRTQAEGLVPLTYIQPMSASTVSAAAADTTGGTGTGGGVTGYSAATATTTQTSEVRAPWAFVIWCCLCVLAEHSGCFFARTILAQVYPCFLIVAMWLLTGAVASLGIVVLLWQWRKIEPPVMTMIAFMYVQ